MKNFRQKAKVDAHRRRAIDAVNEIDRKYPTDKACLNVIWRRVRKCKRCQHCNSSKLKLTNERFGFCGKCGKKFWLTSGTVFKHMRNPRPYLIAIELAERGISFNARLLSWLSDVVYSTALLIFKKVMGTVALSMPANCESVSSFEFDSVICKRSLETSARKHPVTEQEDRLIPTNSICDEVDGNLHAESIPGSGAALGSGGDEYAKTPSESTTSITPEEHIYALVLHEPRSIDALVSASGLDSASALAAISILELSNLVIVTAGNRVSVSLETLKKSATPPSPLVQDHIERTKKHIKRAFHGVSRKYIQIYVAAYWCLLDRNRWSEGEVFKQCCRSNIRIRNFISSVELRLGIV